MPIKDYKNCAICANKGVCVRWKQMAVWLRDEAEQSEPFNYIKLAANKMRAGRDKATVCPKYDRVCLRNS